MKIDYKVIWIDDKFEDEESPFTDIRDYLVEYLEKEHYFKVDIYTFENVNNFKEAVIKEDFDLLLTIKPHVTGSVPVVAALLINPAVGIVAWFANLFFSPAVSQAVAQQLMLTGNWHHPAISQLKQKVTQHDKKN